MMNVEDTNDNLVRTYLTEIGKIPLLTQEEEFDLGSKVQKWLSLENKKSELEEKKGKKLSKEEWVENVDEVETKKELLNLIEEGKEAREKMIKANLRLVVSIAKKYQKNNVDFLDLIQEGTIGLERGVEKFEPNKGYKFSTYAYWWIRQAITRSLSQHSRTIRVPIHVAEKLKKIKNAQRELCEKKERNPTTTEVANYLKLNYEDVKNWLNVTKTPVSLDVKVGDKEDTELSELLEDNENCPNNYLNRVSQRENIDEMLSELTPEQREVLFWRYGLGDGVERSLRDIGDYLDISRERVRYLEQQAVDKLRRRRVAG
jgi:RNA polymerase nonessential primary-like sigma factor